MAMEGQSNNLVTVRLQGRCVHVAVHNTWLFMRQRQSAAAASQVRTLQLVHCVHRCVTATLADHRNGEEGKEEAGSEQAFRQGTGGRGRGR